ncbi:MAG: ADOP family duplicated permease [Bryobacteraceae bacterium]
MNRFWKRARALWRRSQLDRDLADELRFHQEMQAEEGMDAATARRSFGNATALRETCRDLWAFTWIETLWQDIRYAARTLAHAPGFTIVAVIALALGIGANTTIYTVVSSALAFKMGVEHMERLVVVTATDASLRNPFAQSFDDYRNLSTEVKSIESLAAYRMVLVNLSDRAGLPERYSCVEISANGFAVAGTKPVLGRDFTFDDERPGATPVLILAYHVWQDRYGKDPSVLGRTIRVDEVPRTVIGVMPSKMQFPEDTDLWIPLVPDPQAGRAARNVLLFGRLANGVKLPSARAEMDTIAHRLQTRAPERYQGLIVDVQPFLDLIGIYSARRLLIAVVFAVGFVLLIGCADVANLLLARAAARAREISIRIAIGAGRARIVRQLLVESVLLASFAGVLGWLVAFAGLRAFDVLTSHARRPSWINFSMNLNAFVYLSAISIGAGILFGLAPAFRLAKVDVNSAVKDGGHGAAGTKRGQRLASALVVFEMVLCIVLLTGASLMIRSAINTYNAPIGVNASNVLTLQINLPEAKYSRLEDQVSFYRRLKTKLESLPGVNLVSLASSLPAGPVQYFPYQLETQASGDPDHTSAAVGLVVGADYFRVMQVRPRRGRAFTASDGLSGAPTVIVNEAFAASAWPGEDPIGQRLRLVRGLARERTPQALMTVVGVAPNILPNFRRPLEHAPIIYLPYGAEPPRLMYLIARTIVPPSTLAEAFRKEIQNLDENLPVFDVGTLQDRIAVSRMDVGSFTILFTIFAGIALVLASVGLYAVVAHSVSQRTREIGVRMAVGGTGRDIVRLVFSQGMWRIAAGLAIGLPLGAAVTFVLRAALVGVAPGDPLSLAGAALVLILAGLLGCAIPARRAVRVDPVVALRCD